MKESKQVSNFYKTVDQINIHNILGGKGHYIGWELGSGDANLDKSWKLKLRTEEYISVLSFNKYKQFE